MLLENETVDVKTLTGFTEAGRPMEKPEERLTLAASAPEVMARSAAAVRRTSLVLCISN